jgi:hypothetical protein
MKPRGAVRQRIGRAGVLVLVVASLWASTQAYAGSIDRQNTSRPVPVLGYVHFEFNGQGFGHPHPRRVFNGGDPAGLVDHLTWVKWGAAKAYGNGKTYTFKPHGGYYKQEVKMKLRASDLGACHGKLAYRHLYYREQVKPGGTVQLHWHPWTNPHGDICKPVT